MESNFHVRYFDKENNQEIKLPLEKMVGILLALEMDIYSYIEALKAQAVILRTNLLKNPNSLRGKNNSWINIKPIEAYKDVWGYNYENNIDEIKRAVNETEGIVITFNDKLIDAKYHLACGGSTDNSENVIDNQVIYLRRVLCNYCDYSPYLSNEREFSIEEIENLLKIKFPYINMDLNLEISGFIEKIEKDEQGRVLSMEIGGKSFKGKEIMKLLNLDSTRFNISPVVLKFISKGKGHGLGLCQYGAEKMAQEGASFMDILKYYYTGVEIKKIDLPCIKKPLLGKKLVIDPGHGGNEEGYKGISLGLLEKDIVLNISLQLKEQLQNLGATVYLTREKDDEILLIERTDKANQIRPDFFISFHMDYYPNSKISGCEMFYFRNDIESKKLGNIILEKLKTKGIQSRGIKEGNFFIFRGVNVSSLLIELGYLSNIKEEINFKDEYYIRTLVEGIKEGILEYFED